MAGIGALLSMFGSTAAKGLFGKLSKGLFGDDDNDLGDNTEMEADMAGNVGGQSSSVGLIGDATSALTKNILGQGVTKYGRKFGESLFGREDLVQSARMGQQARDYFQNAYPGTNPWEHLGSTGAGVGGSQGPAAAAKQQRKTKREEISNQKEIVDRQLSNAKSIATINANAIIRAAEIAAKPKQDLVPSTISLNTAKAGEAAANTIKHGKDSEIKGVIGDLMTKGKEVSTELLKWAEELGNDLIGEPLKAYQKKQHLKKLQEITDKHRKRSMRDQPNIILEKSIEPEYSHPPSISGRFKDLERMKNEKSIVGKQWWKKHNKQRKKFRKSIPK